MAQLKTCDNCDAQQEKNQTDDYWMSLRISIYGKHIPAREKWIERDLCPSCGGKVLKKIKEVITLPST